jgi:hypothetical protein
MDRLVDVVDVYHSSCSVVHLEEPYALAAVALAPDANCVVDGLVFVCAIFGCHDPVLLHLCYYTEAPSYYTEKAECYTATYAAPVYYTEAHKYYSDPIYYQRLPTTPRSPSIKLRPALPTLPPATTLKLQSSKQPRKFNTTTYASPPYYTRQQL